MNELDMLTGGCRWLRWMREAWWHGQPLRLATIHAEHLREHAAEGDTLLCVARGCQLMGEYSRAVGLLENSGTTEHRQQIAYWLVLAHSYLGLSYWRKSLAAVDQMLQLSGHTPSTLGIANGLKHLILWYLGEFEQSWKIAEQAVSHDLRSSIIYLVPRVRSEYLLATPSSSLAKDEYLYLFYKLEECLSVGDICESLKIISSIKKYYIHTIWYKCESTLLFAKQKHEHVEEVIHLAKQIFPNSFVPYLMKYKVYTNFLKPGRATTTEWVNALEDLQIGVQIEPQCAHLHRLIANSYMFRGLRNPHKALLHAEKAIELYERHNEQHTENYLFALILGIAAAVCSLHFHHLPHLLSKLVKCQLPDSLIDARLSQRKQRRDYLRDICRHCLWFGH